MIVKQINNILSDSDIMFLNDIFKNTSCPLLEDGSFAYDTEYPENNVSISKYLGRLQIINGLPQITSSIRDRLLDCAKDFFDVPYHIRGMVLVEYNKIYGTPNLPPHFDEDKVTDLIINYQLSSTTSWNVGVNMDQHSLTDNSALLFNPNTNIHWRPPKQFEKDEYVRMVFFRLCKIENQSDYPVLEDRVKNEMFGPIYDMLNIPRP